MPQEPPHLWLLVTDEWEELCTEMIQITLEHVLRKSYTYSYRAYVIEELQEHFEKFVHPKGKEYSHWV